MKAILTKEGLDPSPQDYSLLTDLYWLTIAAQYAEGSIATKRVGSELFFRRLLENFGYLIAMDLARTLT